MVYYRNDIKRSGVNGRALVATARKLLAAVGETNSSLSLTLVDDESIRELNRDHRGKDKATDVLSFPMEDTLSPERLLGDIVISVETARRQAADYDAPVQREIERLLIHGVLHLMGHDHERAGERRAMEAEERRLATEIGMPWPYEAAR